MLKGSFKGAMDKALLARLNRIAKDAGMTAMRAGWLSTAEYPDGTKVAKVAAYNEYGDAEHGTPPRPFMRPAVEQNQQKWRRFIIDGAREVVRGTAKVDAVYKKLGVVVSGDIRAAVIAVTSPALSDSTMRSRNSRYKTKGAEASDKPLVDTGHMLATVTFDVGKKP